MSDVNFLKEKLAEANKTKAELYHKSDEVIKDIIYLTSAIEDIENPLSHKRTDYCEKRTFRTHLEE
jgi:hypothetical protein